MVAGDDMPPGLLKQNGRSLQQADEPAAIRILSGVSPSKSLFF